MKTRLLALSVLVLGTLAVTTAEVRSDVRVSLAASGRRVICNETPVEHGRRTADKLLPIPDISLEPLIARHAGNQQLDPRLVRAVIQVESGYNVRARSIKGAMGLMQLMPGTANELAVANAYDPDQNLRGGTTYLRRMLDRFKGRIELAVAAYDAGPEAVARHNGIPPYAETQAYVKRVLGLYRSGAPTVGEVPRLGIIGPDGAKMMLTRETSRLLQRSLNGSR